MNGEPHRAPGSRSEDGQGTRMLPDLTPLLGLRRHVRVAHHIPGRIRLKLDGLSLVDLAGFDAKPFAGFLSGIEAVTSVRVNQAALSAVVEYDPDHMNVEDWIRLLQGSTEEVEALLTRIGPAQPSSGRIVIE